MKALVLFLLCCLSVPAIAAKKPELIYEDAVLKSMVLGGERCTASASSSECSQREGAQYTIVVGAQTLVITPVLSGKAKAGAIASMGYSVLFKKQSCLYGQLPGAHILIRSENGLYHVKVDKRESIYRLVAAN